MIQYTSLLFWLLLFVPSAIANVCNNLELTKSELLALKQKQFNVNDDVKRNSLAKQLVTCLASTDPEIRDGVAYEAYTTWLRGELLHKDTQHYLFNHFVSDLESHKADKAGVYLPFVTLVLSEVVRADRIKPYLSPEQREKVVAIISQYLITTRDYRGFDNALGWHHNVAHSADVLLQLALNKAINKQLLDTMLKAIMSQVVPGNNHFYIYGEPKRLALPVLYIFLRDEHSIEAWQDWLSKITTPQPLNSWQEAYKSQFGLAKLHNTRQFLLEVQSLLSTSENPFLQNMLPDVQQALRVIR